MKSFLYLLIPFFLFTACGTRHSENPAAPGFNNTGSDEEAIEIADKVMEAMGGRKAWDQSRCIEWDFFGSRKLIWDKKTGMVRINYHNEDQQAVINIHTREGQVRKNGELITQPDSLSKYLDQAYRTWINDSYWLVMPYKLKDSGVTLKYLGEDNTRNGDQAYKLQLTFESVGVTPQNKYNIWVDQKSYLVTQWAFFRENSMDEPNFITPWADYRKYGGILLSGDRGDRKLTDIAVLDRVPEGIFTL
jgi:plasmid maintenance system killer protein